MQNLINEKRHFRRISFISSIHLILDEQAVECVLLDISLKGLMIERPENYLFNKNAVYQLTLILSENVTIDMQAKLVHSTENYYGLEWVGIDLDSLATLRRLLELNSKEPEEIYRELGELVTYKE